MRKRGRDAEREKEGGGMGQSLRVLLHLLEHEFGRQGSFVLLLEVEGTVVQRLVVVLRTSQESIYIYMYMYINE